MGRIQHSVAAFLSQPDDPGPPPPTTRTRRRRGSALTVTVGLVLICAGAAIAQVFAVLACTGRLPLPPL